jgi:hypothetical protein
MPDEDNETWLLNAGGRVIEKMAAEDYSSLTAVDRLTYCIWAADYGMRNAGDLETVADLNPTCLDYGKSAAQYFRLFDEVVS